MKTLGSIGVEEAFAQLQRWEANGDELPPELETVYPDGVASLWYFHRPTQLGFTWGGSSRLPLEINIHGFGEPPRWKVPLDCENSVPENLVSEFACACEHIVVHILMHTQIAALVVSQVWRPMQQY